MNTVDFYLRFVKDNTALPIAAILIAFVFYSTWKSFVSSRNSTMHSESAANRLARIEKALENVLGGSLREGSIEGTLPELRLPGAQPSGQRGVRADDADSVDENFYRSRGYKIAETPSAVARRLLQGALEKEQPDLTIEQALSLYRTISDQQNRVDERANLRERTEQQLASSASTKTSMIWLFLSFNTAVIFMLIFSPALITSAKDLVLGLYVSMAMFIVYVFRSSNARALTLLAITEDLKRYHDAEKYMNSLRPAVAPSERDVEILRLILTNRSEREKNAEHPYELILKGISNSTILMKGGKVSSTESKPGKDPEKPK